MYGYGKNFLKSSDMVNLINCDMVGFMYSDMLDFINSDMVDLTYSDMVDFLYSDMVACINSVFHSFKKYACHTIRTLCVPKTNLNYQD